MEADHDRRAAASSVLDRDDVDTDQIIPKQFLKRVERTGLRRVPLLRLGQAAGLGPPGEPDPRRRAQLRLRLVAASTRRGRSRTTASRRSSRRSFADIFHSNCTKIGLLPVALAEADVQGADGRAGEARDRPRGAGGRVRRPRASRSTSTPRSSTACSTASTTSAITLQQRGRDRRATSATASERAGRRRPCESSALGRRATVRAIRHGIAARPAGGSTNEEIVSAAAPRSCLSRSRPRQPRPR